MSSTVLRSAPLVARTRWVEEPLDPFTALDGAGFGWWRDGTGFVARGVAARVPLALVEATLAGIQVEDPVRAPGSGAIAVGALAYRAAAAEELVVPATVLGSTADGRVFRTDLGGDRLGPAADRAEPTTFAVRRGLSRRAWRGAVERVLDGIREGRVEKVVLARDVTVDADVPFDVGAVARRLRTSQPGCFVFASGGLVGASPELLVARAGAAVRSRPLAGTAPDVDETSLGRLAASVKDAAEHRFVVDAVTATLARCGVRTVTVRGPDVQRFAGLAHLGTEIAGRLPAGGASGGSGDVGTGALSLARALHPTPAVGGTPTAAADALIAELEPAGRGRYAGPVGWVDGRGDGEWAVALRSAQLDGCRAVLHAGAGIVAGSDPEAEWRETEAKFAPMLDALVRP
jgi:menaquinone-specific isochorismate synthase